MRNNWRKFDLYILSLNLLFIFFIVITFKLPVNGFDFTDIIEWEDLLTNNIISAISLILLGYSLFAFSRFNFDLRGATDIPFEVIQIQDINYEHLTFLATYIVPLISFDFSSNRQMVVLALLLLAMGIIYIKTDLFYANPSLALLGFRIYRGDGNFKHGNKRGIIMISRNRILEGTKVHYIKLDDRIYYVKEAKEVKE